METEITCLFCGGVDKDKCHECPVAKSGRRVGGQICGGAKHFGFCTQCVGILVPYMERQMRRKMAEAPKLRVEEEDGA